VPPASTPPRPRPLEPACVSSRRFDAACRSWRAPEGIPGHSVQREIELYVEAGFTPLEALQAATIVPARAMKLDAELGTIEKGKRADMVVLNANPLERIQNIRSARWTIIDGRVYDTQALWRSVRFQP
jgi:adenine deaminase